MSAAEFAAALADFGPFESHPEIAIGLSGGRDSLALALLLAEWTKAKDGRIFALIVDHGLRPDSATEAAKVAAIVARWRAEGLPIAAEILRWEGSKPKTRIQDSAREARYALMIDWCRARDILHLAIAHQAEDQAETHLMRAARGSTDFGQAGMSASLCREGVRVLRPLLGFSRRRLTAFLTARGQSWIEDPSNRAPRFARAHWRAFAEGRPDLAARIAALGQERRAREFAFAAWARSHIELTPLGHAWLEPSALEIANPAEEEGLAFALGRLIRLIGAEPYAPNPARLLALAADLRQGVKGRTLGGCRILRLARAKGAAWLFAREAAAISPPFPVAAGVAGHWDRRFAFRVAASGLGLALGALGEDGLADLAALGPLADAVKQAIPEAARAALPALRRGREILAVPHFGFGSGLSCRYRPQDSLTGCGFTLAKDAAHTR